MSAPLESGFCDRKQTSGQTRILLTKNCPLAVNQGSTGDVYLQFAVVDLVVLKAVRQWNWRQSNLEESETARFSKN